MSGAESVDRDALSYVIRSQYRKAAVRVLYRGDLTPTAVADETPYSLKVISRAIQELRDEDVVSLLVDEDTKKGRIYGLTELGESIAAEIVDDGDGEGESDG